MFNPQMTSSQMELLPLVCLCLLSWSGTTSADQHERVVVKEDDDVILPCSIGSNIETGTFDWKKDGQTEVFMYNNHSHYNNGRTGQDEQFKGRVFHFKDELKHGNASIKITNTKMTDRGDYNCIFPNIQQPQTFHVKLVVEPVLKDRTGENIPGAAPKPFITTLHQTDDWARLQCEANGIPELEVTWQDSAQNILAEERQVSGSDRKYITLLTTVTKTGNFSCVATQKNISHRISSQIYVHFHEPDYTGWIVAGVLSILLVVVVGVVLCMCCTRQNPTNHENKHKENQSESAKLKEKQPDPEV